MTQGTQSMTRRQTRWTTTKILDEKPLFFIPFSTRPVLSSSEPDSGSFRRRFRVAQDCWDCYVRVAEDCSNRCLARRDFGTRMLGPAEPVSVFACNHLCTATTGIFVPDDEVSTVQTHSARVNSFKSDFVCAPSRNRQGTFLIYGTLSGWALMASEYVAVPHLFRCRHWHILLEPWRKRFRHW